MAATSTWAMEVVRWLNPVAGSPSSAIETAALRQRDRRGDRRRLVVVAVLVGHPEAAARYQLEGLGG
jgi:hypothetical protein